MASQRQTFLINRPFQLRFSFYVCSWLIALSFIYPLIIANLFDYLIAALVHDPFGPQFKNIFQLRESLLWLLALMQVAMTVLAFLISIFMSHKVAGPLHKLKRYFREAKDGNVHQKLAFREKDYFQDLVPEYNAMMESIGTKWDRADASIRSSVLMIEELLAKSSPEMRSDLESVLKQLKEGLQK